jgi:F0F1-type ATP synthase membrane subunit b/b'
VAPALADFLFEAVNFLLLAAALGWLLFKPVRRALDEERERHARQDEASQRLRDEAEAAAGAARGAVEAADRETAQRRRETLEAAQEQAAALLEDARQAQAVLRQAQEQELRAWREAETAALVELVGRIAAESVARLLAALPGPSLDAALVRAARAELAALPGADRGEALVESARELDDEARALLAGVLGGFEERTVRELGAGVRVTTAVGQVDATAASIARFAARAVSAAGSGATGGGGA